MLGVKKSRASVNLSRCIRVGVVMHSLSLSLRVDRSRVRDVGPDRAAAEWALRLGGKVRFHGNEYWSTDYNRLPSRPPSESLLAEIDVGGVAITDNGLEHLGQCHNQATPTSCAVTVVVV